MPLTSYMRKCFENFISYRGQTSKSGLYIDDLAGIPIDLLSKLKNCTEESTVLEFWDRFYERSVSDFIPLVSEKIAHKFYNNEVIESRVSGEFKDEVNNTSEEYAGVRFNFPESRYLENQILSIKINVETKIAASPSFYVFDREGGVLIDTIPQNGIVEGLNEIQILKSYEQEYLYIAYKTSEMILRETGVYHRYYDRQDQAYSTINQVNGGGLIVEFNNYCSVEKFICSRLFALRYAFLYHLGTNIMKERILSEEINRYTHLTIEKAEQLGGIWENELNKRLDAVFKNMKINDDKLCVDCRGVVSKRQILP